MTETGWLHYALYPGDGTLLDRLVRDVVAPAVDRATAVGPPARWFFLRYTDDLGPHVRLRFGGAPATVDAVRTAVDPMLRAALHDLTRAVDTGGVVGCFPGFYEPEYDRYGGPAGVAAAEAVFEVSSRTALALLSAADDAVTRRRALALALMARADAVVDDRAAFWERYEWHWTGADRPGAAVRRDRYRRQARDRAGTAAARVAEVTTAPATAALLAAYQRVLPTDRSLFHQVHLTNNRLGIPPAEEGYLARLLTDLRLH